MDGFDSGNGGECCGGRCEGHDGGFSESIGTGDFGSGIDIDGIDDRMMAYMNRQAARTVIGAILFIFAALFIVSIIAVVVAAAENGFPDTEGHPRGELRFVGEKLVPIPDPRFKGKGGESQGPELADPGEDSGAPGVAESQLAPVSSSTIRPTVEVDCYPDNLCKPCARFKAWHSVEGDRFPIEFRITTHAGRLPDRIYSNNMGLPAFFWLNDKGSRVCIGGWDASNGPERFLASWRQSNPQQYAAIAAASSPPPPNVSAGAGAGNYSSSPASSTSPAASPLDLFTKLAGPGKFSWAPDKAVSAYVDDSTHLQYSKIQATVALVGGNPRVTFEKPYPVVSAKKWGMWFKAEVTGSDSDLLSHPPTATLNTTRGKFRIELKEVMDGGQK